jgi:hypothetical protein
MDNSKIPHSEAGESHDLRFSIANDAQKANIEVRDAAGTVVRKLEVKNLKAGANQLQWNGKTDDGVSAPVGDYTLAVEAFGSNGKKLYVQTRAEGLITGVNFTAHGVQLMMGKQPINMSDVKAISDPNVQPEMKSLSAQAGLNASGLNPSMLPPQLAAAMAASSGGHPVQLPPQMTSNAQGAQGAQGEAPAVGPRKVEVKPETKANAAKRASLSKGNIADSAMSQGLINNLNKEGAKAGGFSG